MTMKFFESLHAGHERRREYWYDGTVIAHICVPCHIAFVTPRRRAVEVLPTDPDVRVLEGTYATTITDAGQGT